MGLEYHGCGLLKRISDDSKFVFYAGGSRIRLSDNYNYLGNSNYDAFYWDLTANTGWHRISGTNGVMNILFVKTNPYTGFAFNGDPYQTSNWRYWDERAFQFVTNKEDRATKRIGFATVAIPKTSPFVSSCFS